MKGGRTDESLKVNNIIYNLLYVYVSNAILPGM